jgi:hypothetical protein
MFHRYWCTNSLKQNHFLKTSSLNGQIQQGREGVGAYQGPDTLPALVRNSVVRTPTNPLEAAANAEVHVPKEIIARRIQEISAGITE